MIEFADNLAALRKKYNMSQTKLAEISGIPVGTLRNYEQNRNGNSPSFYNVMKLAELFKVDPYYLMFGGDRDMVTNTVYTDELVKEILSLNSDQFKEVHDSKPAGVTLPKLEVTEKVLQKMLDKLNDGVLRPKRGYYKTYAEQTLNRYAQDRANWKVKFGIK